MPKLARDAASVDLGSKRPFAAAHEFGTTVYKGRLVDIASIKQAEVIVAQSELIAGSD